MTDMQVRPPGYATFEGVALVDDAPRCDKLLRDGTILRGLSTGSLHAAPHALRWDGADRVATLAGVTDVRRQNDVFRRADYEGPDGPAVAFLQDRSRSGRRAVLTTKELLSPRRPPQPPHPPSPTTQEVVPCTTPHSGSGSTSAGSAPTATGWPPGR